MSNPIEMTGKLVKPKLGSDNWTQRSFMLVIALYLVIALALPLYAMLSKAFSTYHFDLSQFEVQVSDKGGTYNNPAQNIESLNKTLSILDARDLATSNNGRLGLTKLFPDFSFRSSVKYKFRGTSVPPPMRFIW